MDQSNPTDPVLYAVSAGVATITLNRPQVLNALNEALMAALGEAVQAASADSSVRAVILTGAGRGFSSGADLGSIPLGSGPIDPGRSLRDRYNPVILGLRQMQKPIISAVNGVAAGAGMSLALCGDIILASKSASFLQAFARIGLVPDAGSTWFLPRLIGDQRARALMMLAEQISAEDAYRFGMVWKLYEEDQLLAEAQKLAQKMANAPTRAFALIKEAMQVGATASLEEQLETEAQLQTRAGETTDFVEGVSAFLQKRAPKFAGK
jgi:2-(1,2-epoxy-1,2-dihydrophenyl)acetyl-CoA isomerase